MLRDELQDRRCQDWCHQPRESRNIEGGAVSVSIIARLSVEVTTGREEHQGGLHRMLRQKVGEQVTTDTGCWHPAMALTDCRKRHIQLTTEFGLYEMFYPHLQV